MEQGCCPWGCRVCHGTSRFGRSVNPISTRGGGRSFPPNNSGTPDFQTFLRPCGIIYQWVQFTIQEGTLKGMLLKEPSTDYPVSGTVYGLLQGTLQKGILSKECCKESSMEHSREWFGEQSRDWYREQSQKKVQGMVKKTVWETIYELLKGTLLGTIYGTL